MNKQAIKERLTGLTEAAMVLTLLFSVATIFSEWHYYIEMFSHFRLQYLAASILLTIPFLIMKWRMYAHIGVAAIAINAWFIVPWYLPLDKPEPGGSDIKILQANVLASNDNAEQLIAWVDETEPDIIVMQEATSAWLFSADSLRARFPYRIIEPREDAFGIALYSKLPLDATAVNESVPMGYPDIIATALVGGKRLNIISTHPMPPIGSDAYGARNLQLDGVAQLAARSPKPLIVVGDLNVTMWSHHYRRFERESGLSNARKGFGINPTWPLFLPIALIPIDHVMISAGIAVTGVEVGPPIGSDHLPLLVRIRLMGDT